MTGIIVARGELAVEKWQSKDYSKHFRYVRNVFTELYDVFLRMEQKPGKIIYTTLL